MLQTLCRSNQVEEKYKGVTIVVGSLVPPVKINLRCWVFAESGRIALIYIYCRAELTCSASAPALARAFTRLATGRDRPFNGFAYPLQVSFPPFLAKHLCLLLGGKVITSHLRISSQCPYRYIRVPLDPLSAKSYRMTALRYLLFRGGWNTQTNN